MSEDLERSSYTFVWSIENFSFCSQPYSECIQSPVFLVEILDGAKFYLSLYPRGKTQDDVIYFDFSRDGSDCGPEIARFHFSLSLCADNEWMLIRKEICNAKRKTTLSVRLVEERKDLFDVNEVYLPNDILTLQCCLIPKNSKYKSSKKCFANTVVKVERHTFVVPWISTSFVTSTTSNISFRDCFFNVPFHIQSEQGKFEFQITCCLNLNKKGQVQISRTGNVNRIFVVFKLFLEDLPQRRKCIVSEELMMLPEENEWVISFSADKSLIELVPTGEMFPVRLDFTISDDSYATTSVKTVHDSLETLSDPNFSFENGSTAIWKAMFNDKSFCDVIFRVENADFSAHKCVLCASSPVFRAMLENDMKEKDTGVVEISDMTKETVQQLLSFIYTGSVADLQQKTAVELYVAGDKYQIPGLKLVCSSFMKAKLAVENVCDILEIASLYQDQDLERKARGYISSHAKSVFDSNEWNIFMQKRLKLAADIMLDLCRKFSE